MINLAVNITTDFMLTTAALVTKVTNAPMVNTVPLFTKVINAPRFRRLRKRPARVSPRRRLAPFC